MPKDWKVEVIYVLPMSVTISSYLPKYMHVGLCVCIVLCDRVTSHPGFISARLPRAGLGFVATAVTKNDSIHSIYFKFT